MRDTENVPFTYNGGIEAYMRDEVLPYAPDAYLDEKKTTVGYEISFTKNFYHRLILRDIDEIINDLKNVESEVDGLLVDITEGLHNV